MNNIEFTTANKANNKIVSNNNRERKNNSKISFVCNNSNNKVINVSRNIVLGARVNLWR